MSHRQTWFTGSIFGRPQEPATSVPSRRSRDSVQNRTMASPSSALLTDWNSMMKELFRTDDGLLVDQTHDSVSSSGIASDEPYYYASPASPPSNHSDQSASRQGPFHSGNLTSPVTYHADSNGNDSYAAAGLYRVGQATKQLQQPVCYRYRHTDMVTSQLRHSGVTSPIDDDLATCNRANGLPPRSPCHFTRNTPTLSYHASASPRHTPLSYCSGRSNANTPVLHQQQQQQRQQQQQQRLHQQQQQPQYVGYNGDASVPDNARNTPNSLRRTPTQPDVNHVQQVAGDVLASRGPRDSPLSTHSYSRASPRNTPGATSAAVQRVRPVHCSTPMPTGSYSPSLRLPPSPAIVAPSRLSTPSPWLNGSDLTSQNGGSGSETDWSAVSMTTSSISAKSSFCYVDLLTDEALTIVFQSGLNSYDLCRCAVVCRRWNRIVWNPILWTSIDLRDEHEVNVDKALKCLCRILSRDTPTVCVTVVRVLLNGCLRLTDRGLNTVSRHCTELNRLEIVNCRRITNVALFEVVSRCVSLTHLDVTGCDQVTCISLTPEANMAAVTYGHQVYLRVLDMSECSRLDDAGLQLVASYCPGLVKLYVRRCPLVTDRGVQYVAAYCGALREISLAECVHVKDFGICELASRRNTALRYLSVSRCGSGVTDRSLLALGRHCHRLRYLNVRGCVEITDRGVLAVAAGCHKLRSLDVGECNRVTDNGLGSLAEGCRQLRRLSVRGCVLISDTGVRLLGNHCRQLQQLNVQDCPHITRAGFEAVRRSCPQCLIEHNSFAFY